MDHSEEDKCPLCGGDNACAMAAGQAAETCWCQTVSVTSTALGALPAKDVGLRCICRRCATQESENIER